jgi:hypothetical protein
MYWSSSNISLYIELWLDLTANLQFVVFSSALVQPGCGVQQEICVFILFGASYHRRRWIHHDAHLMHIQWTQAHIFSWQAHRQPVGAFYYLSHCGCEIKHGTISTFFQCWLCFHSQAIDREPAVNATYIFFSMASLDAVLQPAGGFGQVSFLSPFLLLFGTATHSFIISGDCGTAKFEGPFT